MDFQFSFLNFQFSVIDIIGAVIGLFYIISEYRADRWFWPLCLLMSAFYIVIDFSLGYYANGGICVYNFLMSIYGILVWKGIVHSREKKERPIGSCPRRYWVWILCSIAVLSLFFWWLLGNLGESRYPLWDGLSASLTVVGMVMLAQKWWQQWLCWMIVEPIMVVLFWLSGNYASALLYVVYEVVCIFGVVSWRRRMVVDDNK